VKSSERALLNRQRHPGALPALGFEPLEHCVERHREAPCVAAHVADLDPAAGDEKVDVVHRVGQRAQRPQHAAQEHDVQQQQA
jgi:hypothetical protein